MCQKTGNRGEPRPCKSWKDSTWKINRYFSSVWMCQSRIVILFIHSLIDLHFFCLQVKFVTPDIEVYHLEIIIISINTSNFFISSWKIFSTTLHLNITIPSWFLNLTFLLILYINFSSRRRTICRLPYRLKWIHTYECICFVGIHKDVCYLKSRQKPRK